MDFTDWSEHKHDGEIKNDFGPNLFIVGLNPRWQMYKFLPHKINVMYSAGGFWDNKKSNWRRGTKFKKSFGIRWLDSGGFTMLNQHGDYPFSVTNYANLVARLRPNYYASMDYPCEPEISRNLGLMSNEQRLQATVKNAIALAEFEAQLKGQMVPVIQGYTLDEYLRCLEIYNDAGLIRDYMAVGSMCRRINNDQLGKLIPGIYYAAQSLGCSKLHFFGLKLSPSLNIYSDMIYSRDSAVVMDSYSNELRKKRGGRRFPRGQQEKQESFMAFLNRLDSMGLAYTC